MVNKRKQQLKAKRRAFPVPPRHGRSAGPMMATPAEPKGIAAQQAVRDEVLGRERGRLGALVAVGEISREDMAAELSIESHAGADMASVDHRGERQMTAGLRMRGRDGLAALHKSGALTDDQVTAGLAYRLCYELAEQSLGSCLGRVGEGRGARDWSQLSIAVTPQGEFELMRSAMDLHRTFVLTKLNQIERAVFGLADPDGRVWLANPTGRELSALRQVAGEGCSIREAVGAGGKASVAFRDALVRALDATARLLRIGEH